ncbi:MAG: hypothetical protein A4E37_00186 [Methanoregulaceae archaeon PtaB.Bin056]|nr:MAG: hypothetical protein A4E37_00186 [Methanoregulaceae archaeon PtaB.Bin056]
MSFPCPKPRTAFSCGRVPRDRSRLFKSLGVAFPKAIRPAIRPMSAQRRSVTDASILAAAFLTRCSTASRRALIVPTFISGSQSHLRRRRLPIGVAVRSRTERRVPPFPRSMIPCTISRFRRVIASRRQYSPECRTERLLIWASSDC